MPDISPNKTSRDKDYQQGNGEAGRNWKVNYDRVSSGATAQARKLTTAAQPPQPELQVDELNSPS